MQNSASPLDIARLPRRRPAQCPERLGFDAKVYIRCQRTPGHPDWCWSQGWSWYPVGEDQARRYKPAKPAPRDVVVPWHPRRPARPQRPRTRRPVRDKDIRRGRVTVPGMKTTLQAIVGLIGLLAVLGLTACSSGHASSTGRVPGDNGTLLPKLSCWLDADGGGDTTWVALAVPHEAKVNCAGIARDLQGTLGSSYTVKVMRPVRLNQVPGFPCSGSLDGLQATAFTIGGGLFQGMNVDTAIGCGS